MKTNPNESISPIDSSKWFSADDPHKHSQDTNGLTKREYFISLIVQGICANTSLVNITNIKNSHSGEIDRAIAKSAINVADALIAELNKEEK